MQTLVHRTDYRMSGDVDALLARCAAGDARAWSPLLTEVRDTTLRLGRWKYRLGAEDAEDVAQMVQIRVSERLGQLRHTAAFPLWVRRLVHHAVVDLVRSRKPSVALEDLPAPVTEALPAPQAEAEFEQITLREDLNRALARLPQHYREPIQLHVLQGIPQDEVGRILGRPRSTVASQIERGLKRLERSLSGLQPAN